MALNDPYASAKARSPRLRVLSGGVELPGLIKVSTTNNSYLQSDSYHATFALSAGAQQLRGTNSSWDAVYSVDLVTRTMSFGGGYVMSAKCKSPSSTTVSTS
jgi:hypothetical protein